MTARLARSYGFIRPFYARGLRKQISDACLTRGNTNYARKFDEKADDASRGAVFVTLTLT
jgi:hypothetical protein